MFKTFAYPQFQIKDKKQQGKIDRSKGKPLAKVVQGGSTPRSARNTADAPAQQSQTSSHKETKVVVDKSKTVEKSQGSSCCTIF